MSLEAKIESALAHLREVKQLTKRPLMMFSGGKDSIVACHLATMIFDEVDMFCELSLLPFKIRGEVVGIALWFDNPCHFSDQVTIETLHEHWLSISPPTKWRPSNLDKVRHWISIPKYAKTHDSDVMIFGRRKQENTVPRPIYQKKSLKKWQCHPIHDWKHEDIWEYINRYSLPYPSCYDSGSKHLYSIVSLAQSEYQKTGDFKDYLRVWDSEPVPYLNAVREVDPRVDEFLSHG